MSDLVDKIDQWLPQVQCAQCGYPHCRLYAEAIVAGNADINQCPPGGEITIRGLAELTAMPVKPPDPAYGLQRPPGIAIIDESSCIGCTLCIKACPVDAIVGAAKLMHTVIAEECTGCELCVAPCPVDCIDLVPGVSAEPAGPHRWPAYPAARVARARRRNEAKIKRQLDRNPEGRAARQLDQRSRQAIRAEIRRAVERARRKRSAGHRERG